jgi:hypothetical protein
MYCLIPQFPAVLPHRTQGPIQLRVRTSPSATCVSASTGILSRNFFRGSEEAWVAPVVLHCGLETTRGSGKNLGGPVSCGCATRLNHPEPPLLWRRSESLASSLTTLAETEWTKPRSPWKAVGAKNRLNARRKLGGTLGECYDPYVHEHSSVVRWPTSSAIWSRVSGLRVCLMEPATGLAETDRVGQSFRIGARP